MSKSRTGLKYKKIGALPIWKVKYNVSSAGPSSERNRSFLSDKGPTLKTLDFTINIGSTTTFLYLDLYLNTAYACSTLRLSNRLNIYTTVSLTAAHFISISSYIISLISIS